MPLSLITFYTNQIIKLRRTSTAIVDTMDPKSKLILALMQIDNLTSLIEGNEYQKFLYSHLIPVQIELQRQLTNLNHSSTIKE